jgi:SET domain-containing protein
VFFSTDASNSQRLARFVNDEPRKSANCYAKSFTVNNEPHVVIVAGRYIVANEEIRYDYGGGIKNLLWRRVSNILQFDFNELLCLRKVVSYNYSANRNAFYLVYFRFRLNSSSDNRL